MNMGMREIWVKMQKMWESGWRCKESRWKLKYSVNNTVEITKNSNGNDKL